MKKPKLLQFALPLLLLFVTFLTLVSLTPAVNIGAVWKSCPGDYSYGGTMTVDSATYECCGGTSGSNCGTTNNDCNCYYGATG